MYAKGEFTNIRNICNVGEFKYKNLYLHMRENKRKKIIPFFLDDTRWVSHEINPHLKET